MERTIVLVAQQIILEYQLLCIALLFSFGVRNNFRVLELSQPGYFVERTRISISIFIFILFSSIAERSLATLLLHRTALLPLYVINYIIHYCIHFISYVNQKLAWYSSRKEEEEEEEEEENIVYNKCNYFDVTIFIFFLKWYIFFIFILFFLFFLFHNNTYHHINFFC